MHGEDGNARIEGIDVALGHELGDGAAAARVGLAKLGHLPDDALVVEELADLADDLGRGVGRAALAAGAGVFAEADAIVGVGGVAALIDLGEVRVVGRSDVGGEAEGMGDA